ncbi:MAG: PD-(D/E)XK nuclease family protein [Planctomycetaceae bacterium]|jgi:RecB family exonuclease|nr:PD-(D/E)XK nuclease family protein [Planctomycetaceae bacterium]
MERKFLGHDRPLLHLAADFLIDHFYKDGHLDLRNVILTLQEKRAINRLEEILAEKAEEIDPAWYPPEFLTIGALPERLYELKKPPADDLTQCFAWLVAMDQLEDENPDLFHRLVPSPPQKDDLESRLALGHMFAKLHRELAAGTLDFIYVAELCRKLKIESETVRWEALAALQKKYHAILDALEIWDIQSARQYALDRPEEFEPRQRQFQKDGTQILLLGVVDMNLAQKELLRHFGNFVTSLVFAPDDWKNRFDDLGCLIPPIWQDADIELDEQQIHVVESASDQAETVLRCLSDLKGKYAPSDIIVGVPDKQIIPFIERQFEQANIESRIVAGKSICQTPIYRFLEVLLPFLESPTFANFATLVRHPDVESVLQKQLPPSIHLLSALDQHHAEFLPVGLESLEKSATLAPIFSPKETKDENALFSLLRLRGNPNHDDIVAVLRQMFPASRRDEANQKILDTFEKIQKIPPELLPKPLSMIDTVRLVLSQVGKEMMPMPHDSEAVELVGWLDLAMDDAEVVIVTGMNDGSVPAFQTSDMFLPDTMRQRLAKERHLSIEDNRRRYARDAYALSCLLATRKETPQRIQLIGSRRAVEGDPMVPSRLFFAADDETVTKRVKRFFSEQSNVMSKVTFPRKNKEMAITFDIPKIQEDAGKSIRRMNVTDFAEYKKCPYRYYLKCCVKNPRLQTVNDADDELPAWSFGSLIHDVLEMFGNKAGLKDSTSVDEIRDFLVENVRRRTRQQYGDQPRPVIAIQVERAVKRLESFAQWQADWAVEHEILATELQFSGDHFSLDVDNDVMLLHGRIDRIDRHKKTNELVIFDYKTGKWESPKGHLKKGEWVNFQLPLYYHLLGQHAEYSSLLKKGFRLGYIVLPADTSKTGGVLADDWDSGLLRSAIEEARNIVRSIWNNEFEKVSPPPPYSEAFAAICNDF